MRYEECVDRRDHLVALADDAAREAEGFARHSPEKLGGGGTAYGIRGSAVDS